MVPMLRSDGVYVHSGFENTDLKKKSLPINLHGKMPTVATENCAATLLISASIVFGSYGIKCGHPCTI